MPRAAIDIGSNSLLLLVVDDDGVLLHDQVTVVGLGKGLGDRGLFQPDRMALAETTLGEYATVAATFKIPAGRIRAVATSAARRALNAETWFARVKRSTGITVSIISGEEEARLTWLGALRDLPSCESPLLVVDLGGGSTELALGSGDEIAQRVSIPVGCVRLTERFLGTEAVQRANLSRCKSWVDVSIQRFDFTSPKPATVVGVGGTVTTLSCMVQELTDYDSDAVHGSELSRTNLQRTMEMLMPLSLEDRRKAVPSSPKRADYLVAGAAILDRVLAAAGQESMMVSDRGLRFGLVS